MKIWARMLADLPPIVAVTLCQCITPLLGLFAQRAPKING